MSTHTSSEPHRLIAPIQQRSTPTAVPRDRRVFVGVVVEWLVDVAWPAIPIR
jgi:hypothetical protein